MRDDSGKDTQLAGKLLDRTAAYAQPPTQEGLKVAIGIKGDRLIIAFDAPTLGLRLKKADALALAASIAASAERLP